MASVWGELKRRNVVRVAIAYAVVSWLLLQLADVLVPLLGLPDWAGKLVLLLVAIGFPLALFFAWAYELTPEGLKRENEVDRSQSIVGQTGRRIDFLIIGVLVVAVGMLLVDKFLLTEAEETAELVAEDAAATPDATPAIAVLPFVNMSADESSVYFSDGLADTVLHMLAQVSELRVAARTSSFQFRDQTLDITKIGEQLNVSAVLEGSVQKAGNKIRVTAQLIDVSNGFHLWSGIFDRELDDVFAIQDEIASEVVSALKVSLLGESAARLTRGQTTNIDAYTEYLLAINNLNTASYDSLSSAVNHLQEAIRLDPNYANAYSTLGRAYLYLGDTGAMNRTEAIVAARTAAAEALEISASSSEALAVLGRSESWDGNMETAGQLLNKAIINGPNDTVALSYYARYLLSGARPVDSIAIYQKILRLDPLSVNAHFELATALSQLRRHAEASAAVAKLKSINPKAANTYAAESHVESRQGHWAADIAAQINYYALDPDDPEGLASLGHAYLALDMPAEASRWFDRGVELDPQHPMSRSAPLFLNYYLQQNEDDNARLARELLEDRIDNRWGSQTIALIVLVEHAARSGRNDVALEVLGNLYPHLFDDPPYDLDKDLQVTYYVGLALIQSGDIDRGSHLVQSYLDLQEPYDEVNGVDLGSVAGRLLLGDTEAALDELEGFAQNRYHWLFNQVLLERSSVFDPIRNEPAFIALLDEYRENTAEQRRLLQAMNDDASGK